MIVAGGVQGATAHHLVQVHSDEDAFLNYDFLSENHASTNVDWGISLLFWNNSSVNSVKKALDFWFPEKGGSKHTYINNGAGWKWESDKGRKEYFCTIIGDNVHYRIYGPPSDHFFNQHWGHYNIASVHIDHNECNAEFLGQWFGASEKAEEIVASVFAFRYGRRFVKPNTLNFENFQKPENEGNHHWESDAFATKLKMPERFDKEIAH